MHIGLNNLNILMPVTKLKITNKSKGKSFYVLYNPETYTLERSTKYSETSGLASNAPSIQFIYGTTETLKMQLFFDSFSAGAEVGGNMGDRLKFAGNSLLPSIAKQLDVRDYTSKVYDLMLIEPSKHVPPLLKLEWSSLQFEGHLVSCTQNFTKFNEMGKPVRATLDCVFKQYIEPGKIAEMEPNGSPDTAKYRTVQQGDALWAFAALEFGRCSMWRAIAEANAIDNPRLMNSGDTIEIPAL